jgi:Flp pilus assembly protein TadG
LAAARRGAAGAEFVLIIGLLATILFVTLEVGLALDARMALWSAAREGARRAAIEGGDTLLTRQAIDRQIALTRLLSAGCKVEILPYTASYGTTVTVSVEAEYRWRTPVGRLLLGEKLVLRAEVQSRSEKVRTGT